MTEFILWASLYYIDSISHSYEWKTA